MGCFFVWWMKWMDVYGHGVEDQFKISYVRTYSLYFLYFRCNLNGRPYWYFTVWMIVMLAWGQLVRTLRIRALLVILASWMILPIPNQWKTNSEVLSRMTPSTLLNSYSMMLMASVGFHNLKFNSVIFSAEMDAFCFWQWKPLHHLWKDWWRFPLPQDGDDSFRGHDNSQQYMGVGVALRHRSFPGGIHPGRLTAGTYSHHPFGKENDLPKLQGIMFHVNLHWPVALQVPKLFGSQLLIGNPRRLGEVRVVELVIMCWGLNSHDFRIIGDGHQANSRG